MDMLIAMLLRPSMATLHMGMVMALGTVTDMAMQLATDMAMDFMDTTDTMEREKQNHLLILMQKLMLTPTMDIMDMESLPTPTLSHIPMPTAMWQLLLLFMGTGMDLLMDTDMDMAMDFMGTMDTTMVRERLTQMLML